MKAAEVGSEPEDIGKQMRLRYIYRSAEDGLSENVPPGERMFSQFEFAEVMRPDDIGRWLNTSQVLMESRSDV